MEDMRGQGQSFTGFHRNYQGIGIHAQVYEFKALLTGRKVEKCKRAVAFCYHCRGAAQHMNGCAGQSFVAFINQFAAYLPHLSKSSEAKCKEKKNKTLLFQFKGQATKLN